MTETDPLLKLLDAEPSEEKAEPGYLLQEQAGFLLRQAQQRHVAIFTSLIGEFTPPQFAALAKLAEVGDTSQNQLGTLIAMDAATIKGVIDRLKARGLVAVAKDEGDKRRLMVRLTGEGRTALVGLLPRARQISQETLAPLTEKEAQKFIRLLARIC
ncbi:MAG: MarR family transcriptional regulator [Rhizobiaceae bacterium]|nr:MarR family transcriptional regulator [Rhizobiaceae bacterium]